MGKLGPHKLLDGKLRLEIVCLEMELTELVVGGYQRLNRIKAGLGKMVVCKVMVRT